MSQTTTTTSQAIRAEGFQSLEGDVIELALMADVAVYLTENLLLTSVDEEVVLQHDTGRMIDFAVAKVASMATAIEKKWAEAHNAACDAEYVHLRKGGT